MATEGAQGGTGESWRGGRGILPRREVRRLSSGRLGAGGNARNGMAGRATLGHATPVGLGMAGDVGREALSAARLAG